MKTCASKPIRRFEDLAVWQNARQLTKGVYRAIRSQPLGKDFALADQMKRAAVSVVSNIAEGFERGTRKQQIEACYVAKGSAGELRAQVIVAHDAELINKRAYDWLVDKCEKCSRQLMLYIRHLRATKDEFPGPKFAGGKPDMYQNARTGKKADE